MSAERDAILEEAARFVEEYHFDEIAGLLARRKRTREDAALRSQTIRATREAMAEELRALKTNRRFDPLSVLREISELEPDDRHDSYLVDAWPLAWKGWLDIEAVIRTNSNSVPPETRYRIVLTEKGRKILDEAAA